MIKFEIIIWFIYFLGLILKLTNTVGGNILIVFSLMLLACFYFIFSFFLFNNVPIKKIFNIEVYKNFNGFELAFSIFSGFALSLFLVGVLYAIMNYIGGKAYLVIGLILIIVCLLFYLGYKKNNKLFNIRITRILAILSVGIISILLTYFKIYY